MASKLEKYMWLIKFIKDNPYCTIDEIINGWRDPRNNELLRNKKDEKGKVIVGEYEDLNRRTFYRWMSDIKRSKLAKIEIGTACDKTGYHIVGADLTTEANEYIVNNILINGVLKDISENNIMIENYAPYEKFMDIAKKAIVEKKEVEVIHRKYGESETTNPTLRPLGLRSFEKRWYLIAKKKVNGWWEMRNYAFDRIEGMEITDRKFKDSTDIKTYYKDYYGVDTESEYKKALDIKIKVRGKDAYYLNSLPLHHSQKLVRTELADAPDGSFTYKVFSLHLKPTKDFIRALISHGDVEVIVPIVPKELKESKELNELKKLRDEVKSTLAELSKRYNENK